MKKRNALLDAKIPEKSGYRINDEALNIAISNDTGKPLDELTREFWAAALPLFVNIYQAGLKGKPLSSALSFVEEMQ